MFDVTDDEDEVLIQLLQKSTRSKGKDDNMTIGFTILKVSDNQVSTWFTYPVWYA